MKRLLSFSTAMLLAVAVMLQSCKKDETVEEATNTPTPTPTGVLKGIVYAANHDVVIPNATVYVDTNTPATSTKSLLDGSFSLTVSAGEHVLHIITGAGNIFHTTMNVSVGANETMSLDADDTELERIGELAYVAGAYDMIEDVIVSLGYTATAITPIDISENTSLSNYAAIFVNCGAEELTDPLQYANLATYVTNGGSMYVSDYGISYIMGNSGPCPKDNGFVNDDFLCSSRDGVSGLMEDATISASDLQDFLGLETIDVNYNLGSWEKVASVDETYWDVLISHPYAGAMLLRTNQFSNDEAGNQGNIYFTTFHNEAAVETSPEVAGVLQFMILNL